MTNAKRVYRTSHKVRYDTLVPVTDRMAKNLERAVHGTLSPTEKLQVYSDLERYRELRTKK